MGGSGGGSYMPRNSDAIREQIEKAREEERKRLEREVNELLRDFLVRANERDADKTREQLDALQRVLGENIAVEKLLFGGSVAKHTFVDGLSDVDALVVLDRNDTQSVSAQSVLDDFCKILRVSLKQSEVVSIEKGKLAVTVRYEDGSEIQLLPAVRTGGRVSIPDASGKGWKETDPSAFQRELSKQNERLNLALVPTVKLVKSLVGDLPKQQRITGYHTEALCLDASKAYKGETNPRALLLHVLKHASNRVMEPINDVTGQSRVVDEALGGSGSAQRHLVSQALSGIARRLEAATSLHQWKVMFGSET